MLSEHEREQLVDEYRCKPVSTVGFLLTCVGGLLVVVALAAIGVDMKLFSTATQEQTAQLGR
jgi:hypothetical protein